MKSIGPYVVLREVVVGEGAARRRQRVKVRRAAALHVPYGPPTA
ncbi:hypothetical protein ACXXDK_02050 [Deinococcus sp. PESE-38]